jgi:hypothetical protein
LDFKYVLERIGEIPLALGVQVQGRSFCLVVKMEDKTKCRKLAEAFLAAREAGKPIWFDFSLAPPSEKERPLDKNRFKQFSGDFYYRSRELLDVSASHIVDSVVRYAMLIRENEEPLKRQIHRGLS